MTRFLLIWKEQDLLGARSMAADSHQLTVQSGRLKLPRFVRSCQQRGIETDFHKFFQLSGDKSMPRSANSVAAELAPSIPDGSDLDQSIETLSECIPNSRLGDECSVILRRLQRALLAER